MRPERVNKGDEMEQSDSRVSWSHRPGEEAPASAEGVKAGSLEEAGSEWRPAG